MDGQNEELVQTNPDIPEEDQSPVIQFNGFPVI